MFCFPNHVANVVVSIAQKNCLFKNFTVLLKCICKHELRENRQGEFAAQEHHPHIKEGLDGGYKCQLSVRVLAICQLSVNWLLIINEVIYSYFFFIQNLAQKAH